MRPQSRSFTAFLFADSGRFWRRRGGHCLVSGWICLSLPFATADDDGWWVSRTGRRPVCPAGHAECTVWILAGSGCAGLGGIRAVYYCDFVRAVSCNCFRVGEGPFAPLSPLLIGNQDGPGIGLYRRFGWTFVGASSHNEPSCPF